MVVYMREKLHLVETTKFQREREREKKNSSRYTNDEVRINTFFESRNVLHVRSEASDRCSSYEHIGYFL